MHIYEIFLKKAGKDPFEHAGSLEAPDDELASVLALQTYVRRGEGDAVWLVRRDHLVEVEPSLMAANVDPPHRHNDGQHLAERRREHRRNAVGTAPKGPT
ncbi:MAG: 1,2-phenylacetyl-CoA epoxidase subunit B [Acidimicrobiales bacterium]